MESVKRMVTELTKRHRLPEPFFTYQSPRQSGQWHPVLYGMAESYAEAEVLLKSLPSGIRANKPLIRQLSTIQKIIKEN